MIYSYICKECGSETRIDEKDLLSGGAPICRKCLRQSAVIVKAKAPKRRESSLTPEQESAARYCGRGGAVLTLGGPGSGKTGILTERALYLHREIHVPSENIVILAFTRRTVGRIVRDLNGKVHDVAKRYLRHSYASEPDKAGAFVGTFPFFCLGLMRIYCGCFRELDGWSRDADELDLIDRAAQCDVLEMLRGELALPEKERDRLVPDAEELCRIFSYTNSSMIDVAEYFKRRPSADPATAELVTTLAGSYAEYKRDHRELDYDDLLSVTARALMTNAGFREVFRDKYYHVLVDDIQYARPVEWAILRAICPSARLFCTGDDSWSGCASEFAERFPDGVTLRLPENGRTAKIAALADELLKTPDPDAEEASEPASEPSGARTGDARPVPEIHTFASDEAEAAYVLASIRGRLANGVPPGRIALVFGSADRAQAMERALGAAGIPYRFLDGASFLQKPHVRDLLSAVDALNDIRNEPAWRRFLGLHPGVGEKTIAKYILGMREALAAYPDNQSDARTNAMNYLSIKLSRVCPQLVSFLCYSPSAFFGPDHQMRKILEYFDQAGLLKRKYNDPAARKKDLNLLIGIAGKFHGLDRFSVGSPEERFSLEFKLAPDTVIAEYDRNAEKKLTLVTARSIREIDCDCCCVFLTRGGVLPPGNDADAEKAEAACRTLYDAMARARKEIILTRINETQTSEIQTAGKGRAANRQTAAGPTERNEYGKQ